MIILPLMAIFVAGAAYGLILLTDNKPKPQPQVEIVEAGPRASAAPENNSRNTDRSDSTGRTAPQPMPRGGRQDEVEEVESHPPGPDDFEPGVILVVDPPPGFSAAVASFDIKLIDEVRFQRLGIRIARYSLPVGLTPILAIRIANQQFPNVLIAPNDYLFKAQATPAIPSFRRGSERRKSSTTQRPPPRSRTSAVTNGGQLRPRRSAGPSSVRQAIGWQQLSASCGTGVRIGLADTPVALGHPALKGQKISFRSFHNKRRQPGPADHGTAVAAILVGKTSGGALGGLLPSAQLWAANIFEINRKGKSVGNTYALIRAMDWLVAQKLHVLNLSIAGKANKILARAIKKVRENKLIVVAAAGNWASETRPAYPAAYPESIAVTAVDINRNAYRRANRGSYIEFAMPGVKLWTASGGGAKFQTGTSYSAPFITALVGLEVATNPAATIASVRKKLAKAATDLGQPGRDRIFGWGLVATPPRCTT